MWFCGFSSPSLYFELGALIPIPLAAGKPHPCCQALAPILAWFLVGDSSFPFFYLLRIPYLLNIIVAMSLAAFLRDTQRPEGSEEA